eukprot:NODE_154_length_15322_cov_0.584510.p9 type:complete len:290 gc:universal NODE_154_length_15322_cov_0.584510:14325-15194(+)
MDSSMNFNSVVHYLASEFKKFERERLEWQIEKNTLLSRIAILEGEKRSIAHLNADILEKLTLSDSKIERPAIDVDKKKDDTRKLLLSFMQEAKQLSLSPLDPVPDRSEPDESSIPKSYYDVEQLEELSQIKVEDLRKEKRLWRSSINFRSHFDAVRSVKFIDHFHFMSIGDDGCVKIWNLKCEDPYRSFRTDTSFLCGAILNNMAVCGDLKGRLHLFRVDISKPIEDYPNYDKTFRLHYSDDHSDAIWEIAAFEKKNKCASISADGTLKIWTLDQNLITLSHSLTCTLC